MISPMLTTNLLRYLEFILLSPRTTQSKFHQSLQFFLLIGEHYFEPFAVRMPSHGYFEAGEAIGEGENGGKVLEVIFVVYERLTQCQVIQLRCQGTHPFNQRSMTVIKFNFESFQGRKFFREFYYDFEDITCHV